MAYARGWWSGNRVATKLAQAMQTPLVCNAKGAITITRKISRKGAQALR